MARKAQNPAVETQVREPIDLSSRLPFDHIIKANEHEYDFCIINDARGEVQRHEMMGWKVWSADRLYDTEFDRSQAANRSQDGFASVPCGIAGEGKPTRAYLMYGPKGLAQSIIDRRHAENRERKRAYGANAENKAAASVGGIETYTPQGFGSDGLKQLPNTVSQSQS